MTSSNIPSLKYSEKIKDRSGQLVTDLIEFSEISPALSGTSKKQQTPHNPQGLSLVMFLSNDYLEKFNNVNLEIKRLNRGFHPVRNLHATFLGNFPCGVANEPSIKQMIFDFFKDKNTNRYEIDFKLQFKHIRPGKSKKKVNASDGTVVAIGDLEYDGNKQFVDLAEELEYHLKHELGSIFKDDFKRPFSTVWCTLGYFDCLDFPIYGEFYQMFEKWNPLEFVPSVNTSQLQLVRHRFKNLDGYKPILKIPNDLTPV